MAKFGRKKSQQPAIFVKFRSQKREKKVVLTNDSHWGVDDLNGKGMKMLMIKDSIGVRWMGNLDEIEYFYEGNSW